MLSRHPEFRLNDLICRRYPGAYRHPLDPALLSLPWWLKEAVALLSAEGPRWWVGPDSSGAPK